MKLVEAFPLQNQVNIFDTTEELNDYLSQFFCKFQLLVQAHYLTPSKALKTDQLSKCYRVIVRSKSIIFFIFHHHLEKNGLFFLLYKF